LYTSAGELSFLRGAYEEHKQNVPSPPAKLEGRVREGRLRLNPPLPNPLLP